MKIGILTQPLHKNYGGILQAYALQKVLKVMGHEVYTVDLPFRKTLYKKCRVLASRFYHKYLLGKKELHLFYNQPAKNELKIIEQHTRKFINENITLTERIPIVEKINRLKKYNFDAYVVGSDQVWRPRYSPGIPTFFLGFLKPEEPVKRIAFSASFGVDNWEFTPKMTKKCRKLAQRFDAVSVREESALKLCNEHLGVSAVHLLDPTLLLEKEDYINLVKKDNIPAKKNSLMLYVLDQTVEKKAIIAKVQKHLNLEINSVMPEKKYSKENRKEIEKCIFPPVTQWLSGFIDARFVVTDSFHGTVFAILFNKSFITIGNKTRGMARFNSLLNRFNLTDRLILPEDEIDIKEKLKPINYKQVNAILSEEKEKAFVFLSNSLSNKS